MPTLDARYDIGERIAAGGAAVVYHGRDRLLGRDVAIKILGEGTGLGHDVERFLQEIRVLERLQHPHIVPILGSGATSDGLFYVMPLARGGTLATRLASAGALPLESGRQLARELAGALAHAHESGVVHRDVKPSNVLISSDHHWLADFGIVRFLQDTSAARFTPSGITLGSPEYMSPEQILGQTNIDARTDVYSLGLVIYECLAGVHAFPARTPESSARLRLAIDPVPLRAHRPDVDGRLEHAVMRALRPEPEDRWPEGRELLLALS